MVAKRERERMKSLHELLYPHSSSLKRFISIPSDWPEETVCTVGKEGPVITVKKDYDRYLKPRLRFLWNIKFILNDDEYEEEEEGNASTQVVLCRLEWNQYLYGPDFDSKYAPKFEMTLKANRAFFKRTKFAPHTRAIIPQMFMRQHLSFEEGLYDQNALENASSITATLAFGGWVLDYTIDLWTFQQLRSICDTTPHYREEPVFGEKWWKKSSADGVYTLEFYYDADDGFMNANLILNFQHDVFWNTWIPRVFPQYTITNRQLVNDWLPIDIANTGCDVASRILMSFYPKRFPRGDDEPSVSLIKYAETDEPHYRVDVDPSAKWSRLPGTGNWQVETPSKSLQEYTALEKELASLVDKHLAFASDAEFARAESLLQQIKQMRQNKTIECQLCFLATAAYTTEDASGRWHGMRVCNGCAHLMRP